MMFNATREWQEVPDGAVLPPGCQVEVNVATGAKKARIAPPIEPDLAEARRFLELLDPDPDAQFTFQVFDDSPLKRGHMARLAHGDLDQEAGRLATWNRAGAGVFVTINRTDGLGRKEQNIIGVRSVCVDLDGAALHPVLACALDPHIVIVEVAE